MSIITANVYYKFNKLNLIYTKFKRLQLKLIHKHIVIFFLYIICNNLFFLVKIYCQLEDRVSANKKRANGISIFENFRCYLK